MPVPSSTAASSHEAREEDLLTGDRMAEEKNVIQETDADGIRLARKLLRTARYGALASLEPGTGAPFASRVAVATEVGGDPIILVSQLSEHTGFILADSRCSLLLGEPGSGDPLAHARITLMCRAERLERGTPECDEAGRRYLNRHPKAKLYAGFKDFSFFRLRIERSSLNGGFARAYRLTRDDIVLSGPAVAGIAAGEQSAIEHMNADHATALDLYARQFAGARDTGWRAVAVDPEGIDLQRSDTTRRAFFPAPVGDLAALRRTLVEMAASEDVEGGRNAG
jgi:putative heme iron utilization protein